MAITRQGTSTARGVMEESTPSQQSPLSVEEHDEWKTRLEERQARVEEQLAQITQLLAQVVATQARTASPLTEPRDATEEQGGPALEEVEFVRCPGKEPMQEPAVVEVAQRAHMVVNTPF